MPGRKRKNTEAQTIETSAPVEAKKLPVKAKAKPKAEQPSEIVAMLAPQSTRGKRPAKKSASAEADSTLRPINKQSKESKSAKPESAPVFENFPVVDLGAVVGVPQAEVILNLPPDSKNEIPNRAKRNSRRGGRGGARQRQRKAEAEARERSVSETVTKEVVRQETPPKRIMIEEPIIKDDPAVLISTNEELAPVEEMKKKSSRSRRNSNQRRKKQAEKRAALEAAEETVEEPIREPKKETVAPKIPIVTAKQTDAEDEEDIDLKAPRKRGSRLRLEAPKEYAVMNKMKERLYKKLELEDENIMKIYRSIEKFLNSKVQITNEHKLLCAVSGGVDSVVLLDALAQLKQKYEFSLVVCHFNHKLRGADADADEAFVRKLAADYNLQFLSASGNVAGYAKKNSLSVESAARALRYNFFERTSRSIKADFVVMAHTYDDAAETFLINLIRGSGLAGLSGITPIRRFVKNIMIIRPLIETTKSDIIEYADRRDLVWREDLTNALMKYTRNKVRHELIPFMKERFSPAITELINRAAGLIAGANEFVKSYVQERLDECVLDVHPESFSLSVGSLTAYGKFIRGEIVQYALRKYFRTLSLPLKSIDAILNLMNSETGSIADVSKNFIAARDREAIIFMRKRKRVEIDRMILSEGEYKIGSIKLSLKKVTKKDAKFSEDPNIEFLDYDLVPKILYVRNWREGDSFNPLGMEGVMKISDFLINTKTPITEKPYVYLLSSRTKVIWVIGRRISNAYRVTNRTKNFLRAEVTLLNDKKN